MSLSNGASTDQGSDPGTYPDTDPDTDPALDAVSRTLPVADPGSVRAHTRALLRRHRRSIAVVVVLHAGAAVASLVAPRSIGQLVDEISSGRSLDRVNQLALAIAAAVVVQTILTWFARRASFVMGETIFAELREESPGWSASGSRRSSWAP